VKKLRIPASSFLGFHFFHFHSFTFLPFYFFTFSLFAFLPLIQIGRKGGSKSSHNQIFPLFFRCRDRCKRENLADEVNSAAVRNHYKRFAQNSIRQHGFRLSATCERLSCIVKSSTFAREQP